MNPVLSRLQSRRPRRSDVDSEQGFRLGQGLLHLIRAYWNGADSTCSLFPRKPSIKNETTSKLPPILRTTERSQIKPTRPSVITVLSEYPFHTKSHRKSSNEQLIDDVFNSDSALPISPTCRDRTVLRSSRILINRDLPWPTLHSHTTWFHPVSPTHLLLRPLLRARAK